MFGCEMNLALEGSWNEDWDLWTGKREENVKREWKKMDPIITTPKHIEKQRFI